MSMLRDNAEVFGLYLYISIHFMFAFQQCCNLDEHLPFRGVWFGKVPNLRVNNSSEFFTVEWGAVVSGTYHNGLYIKN